MNHRCHIISLYDVHFLLLLFLLLLFENFRGSVGKVTFLLRMSVIKDALFWDRRTVFDLLCLLADALSAETVKGTSLIVLF